MHAWVTDAFRELFRRCGGTQCVPFYAVTDRIVQRILREFEEYRPRSLALVVNA